MVTKRQFSAVPHNRTDISLQLTIYTLVGSRQRPQLNGCALPHSYITLWKVAISLQHAAVAHQTTHDIAMARLARKQTTVRTLARGCTWDALLARGGCCAGVSCGLAGVALELSAIKLHMDETGAQMGREIGVHLSS